MRRSGWLSGCTKRGLNANRHKDQLQRSTSALRALAESGDTDEESIFQVITRVLARELGMRYAIVASIEPNDPATAHTVAVWSGSGYGRNSSYSLEGTPYGNVAQEGTFFYPQEVRQHLPEDDLLLELGVESYWGTPLIGRSGESVGVLAVLDTRPMDDQAWFLPVLVSFAARASAEIIRMRAESALDEKEKHLEATLASIGDAVMRTDLGGRVTDLNAVAEELTGWRKSDAIGRHSSEVFRILNSDTRLTIEDPVNRCLECGFVVGLEDHTVLVAKDGVERRIADSCAPITDRAGHILGAVLVFRDVTEEYRQQEDLSRLSQALRERVKELECLYRVSQAIEKGPSTYGEILTSVLTNLVEAMQFPEHACARIEIEIESVVYETDHYEAALCELAKQIPSSHRSIGFVRVWYRSGPPVEREQPFTEGEKRMIKIVADQLGLFIDRRHSETSLRRSEERYRAVFDQSLDGICIADVTTGRIIECNPALAEMVERNRSELIGLPQTILHPPASDRGGKTVEFLTHSGEGKDEVIESVVITSSGKLKEVEIRASRLNYHDSEALQGVFREITHIKEARKKAAFQARLLDEVGQAVIVTDASGTITYWNTAAETIYGWAAAEMLGRPVMDITPSEEVLDFAAEIMETLSAGNTWTGEILVRRRDGSQFPAIVSDTPVFDDDGNLVAIIGITTDVTTLEVAEKKSTALAAENTLILRKVNHRTKNNMSTMITLLMLLDKLYRSENVTSLKTDEYFPGLLQKISRAVDVPQGVEIKYAFNGRTEGVVRLAVTTADSGITLEYEDDVSC